MKTIKKPDGATEEVEDNYELKEGEEFVEPEEPKEDEKKLKEILKTTLKELLETPERKKIITGVEIEKSVMETDPFMRKARPFVQLSKEMESFIAGVKELAKFGTIRTKALQESEDTAGGFLVPEEFQAEVIRFATEAAIVRPRARVLPMASNTLTLPKLDQSNYKFAGIDINWEGDEGETKEESQPKLGRVTLKVGKMIGLCPVSDDLLQDSAINLANFLVSIFGEAIAYEEDKQFLTGNGMKKPLGIVPCAGNLVTPRTTALRIQMPDVISMWEALPAWATAGAVWITTKAGVGQLMRMRADAIAAADELGGMFFQPSMRADVPSVLLGSSILMTDKLPAVGYRGDIILANLGAYYIGDRGGLMVASSIHDRFRQDETVFRFVKRVDGQCALNKAFVVLDEKLS